MISPESYYEEHLKGKTKEEIMTTIRGLKQKTGRLKNLMENPYSEKKAEMRLSGDTLLQLTREYLSIAKQAYVESGGTYTLSKSEEWRLILIQIWKPSVKSPSALVASSMVIENML